MGQLGLAWSWIPRREIEPQLLVAPVCLVRLVLAAFTTDSLCLGGRGRVSLGRETRGFTLGKCVKPWWDCRSFSKGQIQSLYPVGALDKYLFGLWKCNGFREYFVEGNSLSTFMNSSGSRGTWGPGPLTPYILRPQIIFWGPNYAFFLGGSELGPPPWPNPGSVVVWNTLSWFVQMNA